MSMMNWIIVGVVCGVLPWGFGYHQERSCIVGLALTIAGSIVTGLVVNEIDSVRFAGLLATVCVALVLSFGCNVMLRGRQRI